MARPTRTDSRVDLVLAAVCGVAAFICLILPPPSRDGAAAAFRASFAAPLVGLQEKAELSRRAFLSHDSAETVVDSVNLRSLRLIGVEEENERLRKLLGLASALKWGFIPAEALTGRGLGDEVTLALSAGKRAGVEVLSPVVTAEGLVGMVERVDDAVSIAIVWPHPDFRVSAMAADGSAFGIVTAHLAPGASRYFLELRSVPLRSQLKAGTLVVSSGLGGVYPRGIPIGIIVAELKTAEGYAKSYLVRPSVKLPDISSVMILKPARVRAGMENVWQLGTATDSATKGVIAAADSLRLKRDAEHRDSTRRDTTARPVVRRDSTRRDTTRRDTTRRAP